MNRIRIWLNLMCDVVNLQDFYNKVNKRRENPKYIHTYTYVHIHIYKYINTYCNYKMCANAYSTIQILKCHFP